MDDIVFKMIDNKIHIIANNLTSFNVFIESLKKRLEKLYIKDDLLKTNVVIDIRNIELNVKEILKLFDVLANFENILVNKIIYKEKNNKHIILFEGNVRGGEIKLFNSNTLMIGNVNKGAKVIVNGNLYVIGKVSGEIEFKGINNKLYAASIDNACIKICSKQKQIDTFLENNIISLVDNQILEENFMDRREKQYGKSNCSYIW